MAKTLPRPERPAPLTAKEERIARLYWAIEKRRPISAMERWLLEDPKKVGRPKGKKEDPERKEWAEKIMAYVKDNRCSQNRACAELAGNGHSEAWLRKAISDFKKRVR